MKILLVNQTFYPDVVSTAQHAADLATNLSSQGHQVTVIASRRAYDDPKKTFPPEEVWEGVRIRRVFAAGFGKSTKWRRLLDFATFMLACALRLLRTPGQDVVIALTSPPLVAFLTACFVRLKGGKFLYWVMDLNPDQAVAAGILRASDTAARMLEWMLCYTLRTADRVIALDPFMRQRICRRNIDANKVVTLAPWSHDGAVQYNAEGREQFRARHGLTGKFVVMYSGNHSACHPLDTLLEASDRLADDPGIVFCFVGGGTEHRKISDYARRNGRANIICLPYQPLESLSGSLSAADLHAVVMGDAYVGIVHPCKVYNVLTLGIPILYIGPRESHVTAMRGGGSSHWFYAAKHGHGGEVAAHIRRAKRAAVSLPVLEEQSISAAFSHRVLANRLSTEVTDLGRSPLPGAAEELRSAGAQ